MKKGYILCDSIYTEGSEQANPQIQKVDQWLPWARGGKMENDKSGMTAKSAGCLFGLMKLFWH